MLNMGPGRVLGGYPVLPLPDPPIPHHPGYTSPYPGYTSRYCPAPSSAVPGSSRQSNSAVGLRSVDQLSLGPRFSGSQGITEVYNLANAGNPNDHLYIPGND